MERRENRIPILSLLPTRRLTFPLLGPYRESRCNCLSDILPLSLCMYNAYGALSHFPMQCSRNLISGTDVIGTV